MVVVPPALFIPMQYIFLAVLGILTHIPANWIAATAVLVKISLLFEEASQKL